MKLPYIISILTVFFFSIDGLKSQSINNTVSGLSPKYGNSVLFGKDIIINNQPDQDQTNIAQCSAFNGWLYAVYSYPVGLFSFMSILRSEDNGITWQVMLEGSAGPTKSLITRVSILACGNSISALKIFLGFTYLDTAFNIGGGYLIRYSGEPFVYEDEILKENDYIKDFALAGDYLYPATNSNPFSIAILYSKRGYIKDSLIFRSSSNGGISLDNRRVVSTTSNYFNKVALNYGRSLSWNSGRYFAVWEEQAQNNSTMGHLFTAHTNPDFNSPFTTHICLDSLDPTVANNAKNPSISCQYNTNDNDSSNLTEIVLFDKYISSQNRYDIEGFYNKTATSSNHFNLFTLNLSSDNRQQPSVNFNPFDNTFMVTYYDLTTQKLPFLKNDFNLTNANLWQYFSSGYNDSNNLVAPYPKVALNMGQQLGANVWSAEGTGGNGIAMFDAPYSTYAGISLNNKSNIDRLFGTHPNPCKDVTNIGFELKKPEKVNITLFDMYGQPIEMLTDQNYSAGKHDLRIDVSKYPSGTYIYKFQTSETVASNILIVVK